MLRYDLLDLINKEDLKNILSTLIDVNLLDADTFNDTLEFYIKENK